MDKVRTSLELPVDQWRALKALTTRWRCTLSQVVSDALSVMADILDDPPQGLQVADADKEDDNVRP